MQITTVEIYSARYCPYCRAAVELLRRNSIPFTEIDIGGNWERRDEMIQRAQGRTTIPQIFIDGAPVGGLDELQKFEREGVLDRLSSRAIRERSAVGSAKKE